MPNSAWTESGASISLVPSTTPVSAGSDPENTNYLSNQDKINLMAQYAAELATKTTLDTTAASLSVSSTAYDNAVAAINTTLVNAGAPANWATTWPDGTTSGPWPGIQTALSGDWAQVAQQRAILQGYISAAQAAAAQAAAVAAAVSAAQTSITNAINTALAALKTAFFLGKWWNAPFPSGGGDLAAQPAAVTMDQSINYSTPLSGTPDYPWESVSLEPSGMTTATNFYARWTGYVIAGEAGTYTFGVNSDDGANLYVNGVQLVSNLPNGQGANDTSCEYTQSGTIALSAGQVVPVILEWENTGGPGGIQFIMTPPGGPAQLAVAGTSTIPGSSITAQSITANQIAAGAITAALIAAGTITAGQIAAGAITATQLAAGSVTANALAANSVTAGAIAAGAINASMITTGTLNAADVTIENMNASNITTGTLSANMVLFPDGTELSTANRVVTMFKQPSSDNIAVSASNMAIPGLSWSVTVHSAADAFNFFGALTAEQTSGTTNNPVNVYFYVDGAFAGSYPCVPRFPALNTWYVFPIAATITGLSTGAHTISIWANNNGYPFTIKEETRVTCQQVY